MKKMDIDENLYLLDIKLLSSLKPIKSKVINLENNQYALDIKENKNNINKETKIENNLLNTNLLFPSKLDFNITSNSFYNFNNEMTNLSIKYKSKPYNNNIFQDPFYLMDKNINDYNNQSIVSFGQIKSKEGFYISNNKNNISQESFYNKNYIPNNNNILKEEENFKNNLINSDTLNLFSTNINSNNINKENIPNIFNNNFNNNFNIININNNINNNSNNICFNNCDFNYNQQNFECFLSKKRISSENGKKENKKIIKKKFFKTKIITRNKDDKKDKNKKLPQTVIFNCYHNKKNEKHNKNNNNSFYYYCSHPNCDYKNKTLKQLQNHHHKMISECQNDIILLLKLIYKSKLMLVKFISNDINKNNFFSEFYEKTINNISFNEYVETICGFKLNEIPL